MGSRALRKLQREQLEKQLAASQSEQDDVESEEEEEEPVIVSKPKNAFDLLEGMADEEEDDSDLDKDVNPTPAQPTQPTTSQPSSKPKKKKKKQKKKQKDNSGTSAPESKDVSEDEIDKALKELSLKNANPSQNDEAVEDTWEQHATQYLSIDQKNLDPVNEMRGLFGNIALEENASRAQPTRQREQNLQGGVDLATALGPNYSPSARGKKLGALAKRRNCFVQGKEDWPMGTSGGLSMEAITPNSFEKQYNLVHSQQYKDAQWQFRLAVDSMQAESMINNLRLHPYHIASLLQVSEIAKHQGDSSLSGDLLERALFTLGRSVHSSFPAATRGGTARLSFDKPANRELYLAIWRYIRNLEQRGTWKTAFEWSKLLLQFNTQSDPYGVTLMIDQLALRGRQHEQFLHLASDEAYGPAWSHLPNIQISRTLALLRAQKPKEARQQLAVAIHHYPYILSALASAIEVTPIPKSLWGKTPTTDGEKLYTDLYVTRAKDLWNTPETIGLISEVANTAQYYKSYVDQQPAPAALQISLEEARHVMALEVPTLIALLPRKFTTMSTSSTDVLPPPSSEEIEAGNLTQRAPANAPSRQLNVGSLFNRMFEWFSRPADANNVHDGDHDRDHEAEDMAAMREFLGPEARELPDDLLRQLYHASIAQRLELDDEDGVDEDLGHPMAGGFDYYADAGEGTDSDMPDLESEHEETTTQPPRGPHAATVEEDEDEDAPRSQPRSNGRAPLAPLLRSVDDTDDSAPAPASAPGRPLTQAQILRARMAEALDQYVQDPPETPTPASQPAPPTTATVTDAELEADPQRLQRWLITTGLDDLKNNTGSASNGNASTYVRRLKMLHRNQQGWILGQVRLRGGADLAARVERML